jgi:hypothetical protein
MVPLHPRGPVFHVLCNNVNQLVINHSAHCVVFRCAHLKPTTVVCRFLDYALLSENEQKTAALTQSALGGGGRTDRDLYLIALSTNITYMATGRITAV